MHFRVRKNVIQLIRITYDETKKKGNNVIIGTVKLSTPELSEDLQKKMTEAEISAFQGWLDTQHRTVMLREEIAALTLADAMVLAEKWFDRENQSSATHSTAQDIIFHWQSLRKVFVKKGLLE
ncbi:MAG: hypothetical protein PHH59_13580 [Methylovulum sp.]|uniref:hypothetical protein n=1 Tax=Methylovulum sp. TaxID=1916980 RepID=UPI002608D390|nr:hypothetical protein [Methylovulum sp.]MDD2725037.1 hypothetical protein [Methylovulum sp.]MDD5124248.1 hypothetical protein [Methylovulum sp.]